MDQLTFDNIQVPPTAAPRVTMEDIESAITGQYFFTGADGVAMSTPFQPIPSRLTRLTFCVLMLRNGFLVTGESVCVSPENFDAEIGRRLAREDAINKCWPLFGFALSEKIHADQA